MKKILSILIVALLAFSGVSYADSYGSDAITIMGQNGANGVTPTTMVVPVRYGLSDPDAPTLSSGDVVIWDTTSADGFTISACVADNDGTYAGVLVSTIQTADNQAFRRNTRNWGWMAVKGYCLADVDTSGATVGERLYINGATLESSFGTIDLSGATAGSVSVDAGVLLEDTGSDGLMKVWLD